MPKLLLWGAYEHIAHEQSMIGTGAHDPNFDPVTFIPSGKAINDIYSGSSVQIIDSALSVSFSHL